MRRTHLIRTGAMSLLMIGFAGASILGIGVGTAAAATSGGVKGSYPLTYTWSGQSTQSTTLTLGDLIGFWITGSGGVKWCSQNTSTFSIMALFISATFKPFFSTSLAGTIPGKCLLVFIRTKVGNY